MIKRPVLTVLGLVLLTLAAVATTPFTSKQGRFSVVWPGSVPKPTTQTTNSAIGKLQVTMYISDLGSRAVMVGYNDYPASVVPRMNPKKALEGARDGAMKNIGGTVSSQKPYQQQGHPALTFRFGTTTGLFGQANLVMDGGRLYQVMYYTKDKADLDKPEAQNFINSFKIIQ